MSLSKHFIYFFIFSILFYISLYAQEKAKTTKTSLRLNPSSTTTSTLQEVSPKNKINSQNITTTSLKTTAKPQNTATKSQKTTAKPRNTTTKSQKTTAKPQNTATKSQKTTAKPQNTATKSQKTTAKPRNTATKSQKTTAKPRNTTTKSQKTTAKPQNTATKSQKTTAKPQNTTTKSQKTIAKPQNTTTTFQNITTTSQQPPLSQKEKNRIHIQKKIDKLLQRLERRPNNLNLHFLVGKYYYLLDDFDKAIFHLKRNNKTPSIKGLILLAKSFSQKKDHQQEIRVLNTLLEMHPNSPKVYTDIATAYYKNNNIKEAIEYYKAALQKNRRYKAAYKGLWTVFESQNNFYDMKQIIEDFLALSPNDAEANSKLCQANLKARYADESMLACNRAITLNPSDANNHVYLGLAHRWNGNNQQAEKIIFDTAKKFRKSLLAQYEAAQLAEKKTRWDDALRFYRNCVNIDNRSFTCTMKIAHLAIRLERYEEGTEAFLDACRINKFKTFSEIMDTAGKMRTEKKMEQYYHFKELAQKRCHDVGSRKLEKTPYEPLTELIIKKPLPEEFEEAIKEEEKKKTSPKKSLKSPLKTTKSKTQDIKN